jgi:signal transduction histidine kinase
MNSTRTSGSFRLICGTQIRRAHGRERIESRDSGERYEISSKPQTELKGSGIETDTTEERGGFHNISVADQGPGIEEGEIDRIFEKFYRGKTQRNRVQGTGMGLPTAKAIVEIHGGTTNAVSRMGQGSVFTFSLPTKG